MCSVPGIIDGMEPHELEAAKKAIATELDHMTPQQQAAVLTRVAMESSRREIAARHNSPGKLAQSIDPSVKQTPALEVIDEAFEWALNTRDARLLITCPPQEGKLVAHDTPVPTPTGWTTHGELRPGDKVVHPSGRPVTVLETHPEAMATLRVHIDGLDHIDVHPRHEWVVYRHGLKNPVVKETQWLHETGVTYGKGRRHGYKNYVPAVAPLQFDTTALELAPTTIEEARSKRPITDIQEIPPRPGRCITVDSPDGLYLVGRTMVPTHNSSRISIWGVLRALVDNPDRRIVLASYSQSLARQHSRQARNIIREHGFGAKDPITDANLPDKLGLQLAKDDSAATSWSIRGKAGGLFAVGVGGALTGSRADLLLVDDPIKGMAEADSILERRKVVTWWESVAQTRLAPGAPVVIIQTRWHQEDLAGHVLQKDKLAGTSSWRVVNIPAIAAEGVPDALNRQPGEAMESARGRTLKDFQRIRNDVGERVWSALYMGQPTPAQGGLFNQEWFDRYRVSTTPPTSLTVVSVDPAETGHRDEAGIICLTATPDGVTYMTDDRSGRMQSDEWARAAVTLALETNATTLLYEAYTTRETYERVITNAWRQIRDETRLLARHDGDLTQATLEYAEQDDPPTNPYRCLKQVADLPEQTVTNPPFRIEPWTMKGNKTARAAGTRQAASTGRLRLVGTHPVLEAQAAGWQPGQNSPDRMDALVNAYEYLMKQLGRASHIATPQETTTAATATGADFWTQTLG